MMWLSNELIQDNFIILVICVVILFLTFDAGLRKIFSIELKNGETIAQNYVPGSVREFFARRVHYMAILVICSVILVTFLKPFGKIGSVEIWENKGETRLVVTFYTPYQAIYDSIGKKSTIYNVDMQGNNPRVLSYRTFGKDFLVSRQGAVYTMRDGEKNACAYNRWTAKKGPCYSDLPVLKGKKYRLIGERGRKAELDDGSIVPLKLEMEGSHDSVRKRSVSKSKHCTVRGSDFKTPKKLYGFLRAIQFRNYAIDPYHEWRDPNADVTNTNYRNCSLALSSGTPTQLIFHHKTALSDSPLLLSLLDKQNKALWTITLNEKSPVNKIGKGERLSDIRMPKFTITKAENDEMELFRLTSYSVMKWRIDMKSGEIREYISYF